MCYTLKQLDSLDQEIDQNLSKQLNQQMIFDIFVLQCVFNDVNNAKNGYDCEKNKNYVSRTRSAKSVIDIITVYQLKTKT